MCDLKRPPKVSKACKLKETTDTGAFVVRVADTVLAYVEKFPVLSKEDSWNFLRNFSGLMERVNSLLVPPPRLIVRIVRVINLLASRNESGVRTRLKDSGLLALRDAFVLRCLRDEMPLPVRLDAFRSFSFELVAASPRFQSSGGLLHVLKVASVLLIVLPPLISVDVEI